MRVFSNCKEALNEITRDVFSRGMKSYDQTVQSKLVDSKTHSAKELIGYDYTIAEPKLDEAEQMIIYAAKIFNKPHFKPDYAKDWLEEMLQGGLNPGKAHMEHWPEYWKQFSEVPETGKFAYTYSERLQNPLQVMIERLKESPYRRAAFVPIWNGCDVDRVGKRRVPCTIGYHFLIRKEGFHDRVHIIYMQRSCSLAEFFPFDVYRAVGLLDYVSKRLGIESGNLIHFISSLHCFYKDLKDVTRVW